MITSLCKLVKLKRTKEPPPQGFWKAEKKGLLFSESLSWEASTGSALLAYVLQKGH